MSVQQKDKWSVTDIAIKYTRTLSTIFFVCLFDASRVYVYLMSIFKANIFLPSARSNEELALFSLNNMKN